MSRHASLEQFLAHASPDERWLFALDGSMNWKYRKPVDAITKALNADGSAMETSELTIREFTHAYSLHLGEQVALARAQRALALPLQSVRRGGRQHS